jgi:Sulfatase
LSSRRHLPIVVLPVTGSYERFADLLLEDLLVAPGEDCRTSTLPAGQGGRQRLGVEVAPGSDRDPIAVAIYLSSAVLAASPAREQTREPPAPCVTIAIGGSGTVMRTTSYPMRRNQGMATQGDVVRATESSKVGELFAAAILATALLTGGCAPAVAQEDPQKPNIVFLLTDDQSEMMLDEMPALQEELIGKGLSFENTISSDPLCCPARATFLRGQYSFKHGVHTNAATMGGWPRFDELDLEMDNLPTWLTNYHTGLFGKYLNEYRTRRVPPGWDRWVARIGRPATQKVNVNGLIRPTVGHEDSFFKNRAVKWVDSAAPRDRPFFLWLGFYAPHGPGLYNDKYANLFRDAQVPRTPDYDEADVSDKPGWVRELEPLTQEDKDYFDELYRRGLRADLTVDQAVRELTGTLSRHGELELISQIP